MYVAQWLAQALTSFPESWSRLAKCFLSDKDVENHSITDNYMNMAGDIVEATAALFDIDQPAAIQMREALGMNDDTANEIRTDLQKAVEHMHLLHNGWNFAEVDMMKFIIEHTEHVEMNFDFKKPLLCTGLQYAQHPCTPKEDVLYEIQGLCEYRMVSGIEQWLVQWKEYEERTWEPRANLCEAELDAEMEEWKKKSCSEIVPYSIPSEKDMMCEIETLLKYHNWYGEVFSGGYVAFKSMKEAGLKFEDMQNA